MDTEERTRQSSSESRRQLIARWHGEEGQHLLDQILAIVHTRSEKPESDVLVSGGGVGTEEETRGIDFRCVNLAGYNLDGVDLSETRMQGANLARTSLRGAKLVRADLRDTLLRNTDFTEADLSGANLSGAVLERTIFQGACLDGAFISRSTLMVETEVPSTVKYGKFGEWLRPVVARSYRRRAQ